MAKKITGIKVSRGKNWYEVVSYQDDQHFHLRRFRNSDGSTMRSYASDLQIAKHLAKFNGLYEYKRNGNEYTVTRNGEIVECTGGDGGYSCGIWEDVLCALTNHVYGDESSGYTHNYTYANDHAYEADN